MFKKLVRSIILGLFTLACSVWSLAQEEGAPAKRKPLSKAQQEANAKIRARRWEVKNKAKAEALAKAVDINHASKAELLKLPGISEEFAASIIARRPYKSKADLVTKNAIPVGTYRGLSELVAAK